MRINSSRLHLLFVEFSNSNNAFGQYSLVFEVYQWSLRGTSVETKWSEKGFPDNKSSCFPKLTRESIWIFFVCESMSLPVKPIKLDRCNNGRIICRLGVLLQTIGVYKLGLKFCKSVVIFMINVCKLLAFAHQNSFHNFPSFPFNTKYFKQFPCASTI